MTLSKAHQLLNEATSTRNIFGPPFLDPPGKLVAFIYLEYFCVLVTQSCSTLQPHGLEPARLLCAWNSSGKNIGLSCHFLLQGIFPTQGLNSGLLHCRQMLYHLNF